MNVHTPSFGDEVFEINDVGTGNISNSGTSSNYMYQQQTTPQQQLQTKRMINLHNTSDEYHTANDDSFTSNSMSFSGSPGVGMPAIQQQLQQKQGLDGTPNSGTTTPLTTLAARKQMSPADPNEPAKPLSAYALFFRDTVSAIKQQNPTCSFQELSKIVASMWESLDPVHKAVYNKKNEAARSDYIKQMRIYRQQHPQSQASTTADGGGGAAQTPAATTPQQILQSKPAVFNTNFNQQNQPQQPAALPQQQLGQNTEQQALSDNTAAAAAPASTTAASTTAPPEDQVHLLNEASSVQKCTRENCNKRAIINPDWEDEYCSNECVVVHCRNVFNAWVQSNLEAKQQQQPELQPTQATT